MMQMQEMLQTRAALEGTIEEEILNNKLGSEAVEV